MVHLLPPHPAGVLFGACVSLVGWLDEAECVDLKVLTEVGQAE